MKRVLLVLVAMAVIAILPAGSAGVSTASAKPSACTTLQDGVLQYKTVPPDLTDHYLEGQPIPTGYDAYGYNYQAHQFQGSYANAYLGRDGYPPYTGDDASYLAANPTAANHWTWPSRDVNLIMKWNDAWLSNRDCDDDGLLDRHYGLPSYIGSGAWITNHQSGEYNDINGPQRWNYFVKIVAAPTAATQNADVWYTSAGREIGPVIWDEFATILEVDNDSGTGNHGVSYRSPAGPGFGHFD